MRVRPAEVTAAAWLLLAPMLLALPLLLFFDVLAVLPLTLVIGSGQVHSGGDALLLVYVQGAFVVAPAAVVLCALGTLRRRRYAAVGLALLAAALILLACSQDVGARTAATLAAVGVGVLVLLLQRTSLSWFFPRPAGTGRVRSAVRGDARW